MAMVSSAVFILRTNVSWDQAPIVTSVQQISIEEIDFPSITICPRDQSRYAVNIYLKFLKLHFLCILVNTKL